MTKKGEMTRQRERERERWTMINIGDRYFVSFLGSLLGSNLMHFRLGLPIVTILLACKLQLIAATPKTFSSAAGVLVFFAEHCALRAVGGTGHLATSVVFVPWNDSVLKQGQHMAIVLMSASVHVEQHMMCCNGSHGQVVWFGGYGNSPLQICPSTCILFVSQRLTC